MHVRLFFLTHSVIGSIWSKFHFDQSAGSSHGVNKMDLHSVVKWTDLVVLPISDDQSYYDLLQKLKTFQLVKQLNKLTKRLKLTDQLVTLGVQTTKLPHKPSLNLTKTSHCQLIMNWFFFLSQSTSLLHSDFRFCEAATKEYVFRM